MTTMGPLPFDEVVLHVGTHPRRMRAEEVFALPLSERIRHVIARTVVFLRAGREVDRHEALAMMRAQRAAS